MQRLPDSQKHEVLGSSIGVGAHPPKMGLGLSPSDLDQKLCILVALDAFRPVSIDFYTWNNLKLSYEHQAFFKKICGLCPMTPKRESMSGRE